MYKFFLVLLIFFGFTGCNDAVLPKPKAYLRLEYKPSTYKNLEVTRPYRFQTAKSATIKELPRQWLKIYYPNLKASVDITYRPINNNLKELLTEAEKLVFEHTIKADQITSKEFTNEEEKVYGKMFEILGNAASQVQFHVTDNEKHFLKGSLFFYSKPNYDSIYPAVNHIKKDMVKIIETLQWND